MTKERLNVEQNISLAEAVTEAMVSRSSLGDLKEMPGRRETLGTIERAGSVLELFTSNITEWGPTAVAKALSIPKSRAHATLASLAEIGLLDRGTGGKYRLGWLTLSLGASAARNSELWKHSAGAMNKLADHTGETINLAVLDRSYVVYVSKRQGRLRLPNTENSAGSRTPVHATASGKMLLASADPDFVGEIIKRDGMEAFTGNTIRTASQFADELAEIRRAGIAYDRGELSPEIRCAAAPIWDDSGQVAGVMTVSAAVERWQLNHRAYELALKHAVKEVTANWRR